MKQLSMQIYFKTPPPRQCHPNNTARASFLKSYTEKTLNSLNALRGRKKKSNYVLPTKDLFQIYGHLTQNEELKNTFPTSRNEKKVGIPILISGK